MMNIAIRATMLGLLCVGGLQGAAAKGTVADGVYTSALKNFTVPLPHWPDLKIQERDDADFAIVSFLDRGTIPAPLQSIATLRVTTEVEPVFLDPARRDGALQGFLTQFIVPDLFQSVSPKAALVHGEFLDRDERRLYFAVANIPQGHASLYDPKKRKQDDSVSGLLVFYRNGFLYMVRVEMKTVFNSSLNADALTAKDLELAQQSLFRIMDTMKFPD